MWRGRPGTWTNARAAPAGRDVFCVTPKCVPQLFAKRRSGTRTPAAMYAQVIQMKKFYIIKIFQNIFKCVITSLDGRQGAVKLFSVFYQHVVLEGLARCTLLGSFMSGTQAHKETSQDRQGLRRDPRGQRQHMCTAFYPSAHTGGASNSPIIGRARMQLISPNLCQLSGHGNVYKMYNRTHILFTSAPKQFTHKLINNVSRALPSMRLTNRQCMTAA